MTRISYARLRELLLTGGVGVLDTLHALTQHIANENADHIALQYLESACEAYKNDRPDTKPETRTIEYYRIWDGGRWDTDFIEIPYNTYDEGIAEAVQVAANALDWRKGPPVFVGVYNVPNDEE